LPNLFENLPLILPSSPAKRPPKWVRVTLSARNTGQIFAQFPLQQVSGFFTLSHNETSSSFLADYNALILRPKESTELVGLTFAYMQQQK
jgi:hypothetical protein